MKDRQKGRQTVFYRTTLAILLGVQQNQILSSYKAEIKRINKLT